MTDLRQAVDDYLRLRRSLGHQMNEAAYLLPDFAAFLHDRGEQTVTIAAALDWVKAREPGVITTASPRRITAVRGFARYLSGTRPGHRGAPAGPGALPPAPGPDLPLLRRRHRGDHGRGEGDDPPAAAGGDLSHPDRAAGRAGLRIGEAIKLDRDDIDWDRGRAAHPRDQVRQVPAGPAARQRHERAAGVRHAARAADARAQGPVVLRLPHRQAPDLRRRLPDVPGPGRRRRRRPGRPAPAATPRARDTPSPSGPCCTGIAPRTTSRRRSRRCRPIWGTASQPAPTGTCRRPRNCWPWPPPAATTSGRRPAHDLDRPHPPGVLHRPARPPAPGQPPHHRGLPRHDAPAAHLRPPARRQAPVDAGLGRPDRGRDFGVPQPPGGRARQQRQDPQRPPDRDPLPVLLRRAPAPRARPAHRPRPGHPAQAVRQADRHLPDRRGRRRAAGGTGSGTLGRPARQGHDGPGRPDRPACLRTHRPELRGHHARRRRSGPLRGKGPQTARRPARPPRPATAALPGWRNAPEGRATRCSAPAPDGASAATPSPSA